MSKILEEKKNDLITRAEALVKEAQTRELTDDELFMGVDPNAPPEPEEDTQFTEKQKEDWKTVLQLLRS